MFVHSEDPRVLAWQAANNILGDASQFAPDSAEYFAHIHLAQVYASLASVPNDVLTGLQLAQLEHNFLTRDVQERAEQEVSDQLQPDGDTAVNGNEVVPDNVTPLR